MPIKTKTDSIDFIQNLPQLEETFTASYGMGEIVQAAFENENSLVSWAAQGFSTGQAFDPVKDYDFYDDIQGYEPYANAFIDSESPEQTAYIKLQIDTPVRIWP